MGFRLLINFNGIKKSCTSKIRSSSSHAYSRVVVNSRPSSTSENASLKIQRRWHVGHSHGNDGGQGFRPGKEGEKIFRLGLAADIGLAAGKAVTGYLSGSTAIIADAAHSVSDVVLSGVALLSFKAAMVPKDKEHPYGHL